MRWRDLRETEHVAVSHDHDAALHPRAARRANPTRPRGPPAGSQHLPTALPRQDGTPINPTIKQPQLRLLLVHKRPC